MNISKIEYLLILCICMCIINYLHCIYYLRYSGHFAIWYTAIAFLELTAPRFYPGLTTMPSVLYLFQVYAEMWDF